ncbi:hypothetical protein C8R44DRAFT_793371 [Mycena epipterygia]|nr:hypothetical protein C8R44DRAFT_793371 [Mycena epipterygia]
MPSPPSLRPSHRHSQSSPAIVVTRATDDHHKTNRIVASVRRTLSTAKRRDPVDPNPMYSTAAERNPYNPARFRFDPPPARPTVEQIAMGLHLSRTPHFRDPPRKYPAPASHPQPARPAVPLPPPPARSSLKKPGLGVPPTALLHGSASSTTDVTSTSPSTPSDRSSSSLRTRMSRFLPHRAHVSSSTPSSPRTSTSELSQPAPRKKAVRFSSTVEEEA